MPPDRWLGMKFLCRNCDNNQHVRLQLYVDDDESNEWELIADVTDNGGWRGGRENCDRPRDYIIRDARPCVYFRIDYVATEVTKFSVREVAPLP